MADIREDVHDVGESILDTIPVMSSKKRPAKKSADPSKQKSKKAKKVPKKSWCYEETIALINVMKVHLPSP